MTTENTCSRPDCDKKLRSNNTTGQCATGCRSPEAPASVRATGTRSSKPRSSSPSTNNTEGALERFRVVCGALGLDADAELEAFAQAWLDGVKAKVAEGAES